MAIEGDRGVEFNNPFFVCFRIKIIKGNIWGGGELIFSRSELS